MSPSAPRIAIIGGGPGGLTLLNVLARNGVSATLYERDDSAASRSHLGGTLDLHAESGQAALRGAGVYAEFEKYARPEGEEMTLTDRTGEPLLHHVPKPGAPPAKPEIDRRDLRKVLIDGVPAASIKWGHEYVSARQVDGTNEWEVTFANGATTTVDLLVGADGGHSRVRALVSPAVPVYTGFQIAEISFTADAQPEIAARCGNGSIIGVDEGKMLGAQRNAGGRIRAYAHFQAPEDFKLPAEPEAARAAVLAEFANWAPSMRQLFAIPNTPIIQRGMYELPAPHTWPHRRGVTLLGDAMALMTNFGGKGANIAMLDALELGLAIAKASKAGWEDALDAAVAEYEERMCAVGAKAAEESHASMEVVKSGKGAKHLVETMMAKRKAKAAYDISNELPFHELVGLLRPMCDPEENERYSFCVSTTL